MSTLNNYPESQNQPLIADILLVTVNSIEFRAVVDLVEEKYEREPLIHHKNDNIYYDLDVIGGARVVMVRSEIGSEGPSGATMTISDAIKTVETSNYTCKETFLHYFCEFIFMKIYI